MEQTKKEPAKKRHLKKEEERYDFFDQLSDLVADSSIDQSVLIEKIEEALLKAARKAYPKAEDDDFRVVIVPEQRRFEIYMKKTVVEGEATDAYTISIREAMLLEPNREYGDLVGDLIECPIAPLQFGRTIAQFAKQSIRGDLRAINRQQLLDKFEQFENQLITVRVTQVDPARGTVTVEYDGTELYLSRSEQMFSERTSADGKTYREYERLSEDSYIKVYITKIANKEKKPIVRISRVHPQFVQKLFEAAIPEIQEGIVQIHAVSREAGFRSKIAVSSNNPDVDAVGTCIGSHSTRINSVLKELHGEKIDIIAYSEDPAEFIANSLAPATVISTEIADGELKSATVIVPNDQLSLAIGNKGQNAKLAAKLTGYKIDIKPENQPEPEMFGADEADEADFEIADETAAADVTEAAENAAEQDAAAEEV